jgi:hypothetical protein
VTKVYPIESISPTGDRLPTWPSRYSLDWIDTKRKELFEEGLEHDFMREYMCVAEDQSQKVFTPDMFVVEHHVHTWQPTYAFYDPARSVNKQSATTGWAVWSWVGDKMLVWDGGAELWRPDQIRDHMFELDDQYHPIMIGVEEDGLNEFLMQPIRHEMLRRSTIMPVVPMKAPRGKHDFIRALQPYFRGGHIRFVRDLPVLRAQFLSYPTGRIDGPNALAYALRMRPGEIIYDGFTSAHVAEALPAAHAGALFLALNATRSLTTGVLVQYVNGGVHVLKDYVREADPGACLYEIIKTASLDLAGLGGRPADLKLAAPPHHFADLDTVGLRGAIYKIPAQLQRGGPPDMGRGEIRELLGRSSRNTPQFLISDQARWTLNALCGGYAREINRSGLIAPEPRPGIYATLMQGLEAFAALLSIGNLADDSKPNVQYTETGQRFISALPGGRLGATPDRKGQWQESE